jgi:heme-degrading monooxygenase HmoA
VSIVSSTRLRLRSLRFFVPFLGYTQRSIRQAKRAPGCRGVKVRRTSGLTFWTLTAWQSEEAMQAYRVGSPHREAMRKLPHWCDEAAVARWSADAAEAPVHSERSALPSWEQGVEGLRRYGRLSKVRHPSAAQASNHINVD